MNFIHIPKTGGTSIETALGLTIGSHCRASEVPPPRFAFVRHPLDRLVSVWEFVRTHPKERFRFVTPETTFEEFVGMEHDSIFLKTQGYWLDAPMAFIGRFERLVEDFSIISNKTLPHCLKADRGDWRSYYSDAALSKAIDRYRVDFERFGYVV